MPSRLGCLRLLALAVALSACASAQAAPPAASRAGFESHPAVAIAARLRAPDRDLVPDVTGLRPPAAKRALERLDVAVQVLAFSRTGRITAQYPAAGQPLPPDGVVIVWRGTPPDPPAPPQPAPAPSPAPTAAPATAAPDKLGPPAPPKPSPPSPKAPPPPSDDPAEAAPSVSADLRGRASWYGPGFAGRRTACGDRFDPSELTLASRELRCGTRVWITGPSGGRVEATVTDWGPAEWTGRRFDLSRATFEAIHPLGAGVLTVTVEVLE